MKQLDAFYQDDSNQIQQEETTGVLVQEDDQSFKPHYGNNCMFRFDNGQPQFTIGPHWPLSLCAIISIIVGTYFISSIIHIQSGLWYSLGSIMNGLILEVCFLRVFLKNPGVNFTLNSVARNEKSCQPCKLVKEQGTYHCSKCDICVRGYDHHCPWVGKCIGEGNIIEFQMFLLSFLFFFTCNLILVMI
ncbi:unnamed protein product [Paramecium pentaurelia]|uniref:Palmitoyltransferase n=1 Tax=Paramecium pentaurelia TaxID=43138 RepID=A0A8S1SMV7_9CILI|nr:unnamed protein product [Paramecium pentaurelia]